MDEDLLAGKVPKRDSDAATLGIREHHQFLNLRQSLFSSVLALVTLLYMTAIVAAGLLLNKLVDNQDLHWHASILVAAFVVPPTVLLIALMRGILKGKEPEKDESFSFPMADLMKEVVKRGVETFSKP